MEERRGRRRNLSIGGVGRISQLNFEALHKCWTGFPYKSQLRLYNNNFESTWLKSIDIATWRSKIVTTNGMKYREWESRRTRSVKQKWKYSLIRNNKSRKTAPWNQIANNRDEIDTIFTIRRKEAKKPAKGICCKKKNECWTMSNSIREYGIYGGIGHSRS